MVYSQPAYDTTEEIGSKSQASTHIDTRRTSVCNHWQRTPTDDTDGVERKGVCLRKQVWGGEKPGAQTHENMFVFVCQGWESTSPELGDAEAACQACQVPQGEQLPSMNFLHVGLVH
jgi:hypothetical protein